MKEITMYRYRLPDRGPNPIEKIGIDEIAVSVGTKFYTESGCYSRKYSKTARLDEHNLEYFEEESVYSTEYILFKDRKIAERRMQYDLLEARLRRINAGSHLFSLPMKVLQLIEQCINEKYVDELPAHCREISVPLKNGLGELRAEVGGDMENYPEIYTFVKRPDGIEIDVAAVGGTEDGVRAYLYKDTTTDCYTDSYDLTKEELLIEDE